LLRTQLTKIMGQNNFHMIGITSATPGAGKTFTSVNLAAALSKLESRRVILCDFDLRRGSILEMLDIEVPITLTEYLKGEIDDPAKAVYSINNERLAILPTRVTRRDSSQLIASDRFKHVIERLRTMAGEVLVVCDLPPVFANDDAMICTQHLDGYLLVVDHGRTTAKQVTESINLMYPSKCLGTVLNRYQGGFGDDYGYGYGDSYGLKEYGSE